MESWSIVVGAAFGTVAWLYQKAWDRRIQRATIYENIVRKLASLTVEGLNPEGLNEMLEEGRVLWLHAPDEVVMAFQKWMIAIQNNDVQNEPSCKDGFLSAMRRDLTFQAALVPKFWTTKMTTGDFPIMHASK